MTQQNNAIHPFIWSRNPELGSPSKSKRLFLGHPSKKLSSKSVHNFLSKLADRQTDFLPTAQHPFADLVVTNGISPMDSAYFSHGSGEEKFFPKKIFLDALYCPVAAKPFVLEDFVFGTDTSVASALTAETIFEIMKCIADVDMLPSGRMGSKCEIFRFFNSGYAHDRNIAIFWRWAFLRTGNMLIKANYASVRQSRDSLDRDRHNVTKKLRRRRALKPLEL